MSKHSGTGMLVVLVALLVIVGTGLIYIAHFYPDSSLQHHLSRDIGLALLISGLVTGAYEAYARRRFDLAKIGALLETVYGSGVPAKVWESIKDTLLTRETIRRNLRVELRVSRNPDVAKPGLVIDLDLSYDLYNLTSKAKEIVVSHGLDEHITASGYPCFVDATIGDKAETINGDPWQSTDGAMKAEAGLLKMSVKLKPASADERVFIRIRRREFRECPGSYYLIMTEVTEDGRVFVDDLAEDVNLELMIRPREGHVSMRPGDVQTIGEPLLPGHGLEFKFTNRPT